MSLRRRSYVRNPDGTEVELDDKALDSITVADAAGISFEVHHEVVDEDGAVRLAGAVSREAADAYIRAMESGDSDATVPDDEQLDIRLMDLWDDRQLLDQVIRVIQVQDDCSYLDAVDRVTRWGAGAAQGLADGEEPTLRQIIDYGPIEIRAFDRDLKSARDEATEMERQLADLDASQEVDELGRVLVTDPDERARLLTDPMTFERAFQRRLNERPGSDREEFRHEFTLLIDAGIDPLATMERAQRQADADRKRLERETTANARRDRERERRARQRDAEKRIADAQADLERT